MQPSELPSNWEALITGYVLSDLTPEEAALVKQYLETYPELASEVESLQATLALFPLSLPETKPSERLRSQILQAAATDLKQTESPPLSPSPPLPVSPKPWLKIAGVTALGLIASLGFFNYRLHQKLATAETDLSNYRLQAELSKTQQELSRYQEALSVLKQPNNRLLALKSITPDISSSGSLVIAPNSEAAILTLKNLPDLPEDKVYRLWAFVDGKKIKCAKFNPDSQGKVLLKIPLQKWGSTTEVFISIEPKDGLDLPVGETVIKGSRAI
ncbi:anti-sigma factor domain-containing protein [Calothrix sp. CCY 0018]|uniref:anti-sigma factor n=1 Tax=Calothrix sp. CCY 0018 TaxID=3103864 RepID=UPI0039C6EB92